MQRRPRARNAGGDSGCDRKALLGLDEQRRTATEEKKNHEKVAEHLTFEGRTGGGGNETGSCRKAAGGSYARPSRRSPVSISEFAVAAVYAAGRTAASADG